MTTKEKFLEHFMSELYSELWRCEDIPDKADVAKMLVRTQAKINTHIHHLLAAITGVKEVIK